jgi:hypothetical protein
VKREMMASMVRLQAIEAVIHFPVDLQHATQMDDHLTLELLIVTGSESKDERTGSGAAVKLRTDLSDGASGVGLENRH